MKEFLDNLRSQAAIGSTQETEDSINLILSKQQFIQKMLKEKDGWDLLACLGNGEWRVAERLGLINGYIQDGTSFFSVPRWNNLVEHLRIVNSV